LELILRIGIFAPGGAPNDDRVIDPRLSGDPSEARHDPARGQGDGGHIAWRALDLELATALINSDSAAIADPPPATCACDGQASASDCGKQTRPGLNVGFASGSVKEQTSHLSSVGKRRVEHKKRGWPPDTATAPESHQT
jgi:hypothetical protein